MKTPCGLTMKKDGDKAKCDERREKRKEKGNIISCKGCFSEPREESGRGASFAAALAASAAKSGDKILQT